ncbi:MAG TPA: class I SAM-dependent methyltransferase [Fimbriimonadaceae bacterium]|nr:class I SAM-dependent methyltransferase [Fimbriimonadaceae bacterium]
MEVRRDWHEDERFWELAEPTFFDDLRIHSALPEVEDLIRLTQVSEGARVLDLCCGPGRHSIELARKGMRVTAVDRTARYLDKARSRAGSLDIEWVLEDARRFVRPGCFDLAINMFTSFGYFEDPGDDLRLLANVRESLRPGGKLVMQVTGKEVVARGFSERTWEDRDGCLLLEERRLHPNFEAIENRWTLIRDGERHEIGFVVRLYAATEMLAIMTQAGFSGAKFYGTLSGLPYDHTARRMVVVAVR